MIIDCHIHTAPGMGKRVLQIIRDEFRRNGVSFGLLSSLGVNNWPHYPTKKEVKADNEEARTLAESSRGWLRWLAYLNPQNNNWHGEMERCVAGGAVGIKLWTSLKDKHGRLTNTECVLQHAVLLKRPALIHTFNRADANLPGEITLAEFMELARRHPQTRMIAAHAGNHWPSATGLFCRLPNVWVDICGGYPISGQVETLVREMGADRILFGSDLCGRSQASQLAKVMLADISEEQKKKILYRNAVSLFGLNCLPDSRESLPKLSAYPLDETEDHFCFCGRWPFFKTDYPTPKTLNSALAKNGVKRAYTADLSSIYRQDLAAANNDFLAAVHGLKRIRPLAVINPRISNWQSVLEKTSRKFAGIIIFPYLHNWNLSDQRYADLFRLCRQRDVRIWVNCALGDDRYRHSGTVSRPVTADELLRFGDLLPEAPECVFQGVFENAMATFLKRHVQDKRFRFEISRLTDAPGALRRMLDKYGRGHFVMGSECPLRDIRQVRWTSQRV